MTEMSLLGTLRYLFPLLKACTFETLSHFVVVYTQSFSVECGIYYSYRLQSAIPDKVCNDPWCGRPFHQVCLYEVSASDSAIRNTDPQPIQKKKKFNSIVNTRTIIDYHAETSMQFLFCHSIYLIFYWFISSFSSIFVFTVAERSAHQSPKLQYCVWRMSLLQQGNIQLDHK